MGKLRATRGGGSDQNAPALWLQRLITFTPGLVILVFLPTLSFPFVALDDAKHIWENPYVMHLSPANLWRLWENSYYGLFVPVTYTYWSLLAALSKGLGLSAPVTGISALLFHASSVGLHATNCWLLRLVLQRLSISGLTLALTILIFALHPLQVESIAWSSSAKDLLSATFSLLATLAFLDRRWWLMTALGALAILAKPAAVVLPVIWMVLEIWRRPQPLTPRDWLKLMQFTSPILGVAVAVTIWTQSLQPLSRLEFSLTPINQIFSSLLSLGFYVTKWLWPVSLVPDYGWRPDLLSQAPTPILATYLAGAAALGVAWLWGGTARRWPAALVVAGLLPVLGLVPFEFQNLSTVADRYVYLWPALGLSFISSQAVLRTIRLTPAKSISLAACVILALGALTVRQMFKWKDSKALFEHTLMINPASYLAANNLGLVALRHENYAEAESYFTRALNLRPNYLPALANLGVVYFQQGNMNQTISHYERALRLVPEAQPGVPATIGDMHFNLGAALINTGRLQSGVQHFEKTLIVNPDHFLAHLHLARIWLKLGARDQALRHLGEATRLAPTDPRLLEVTKAAKGL